MDTTSDTTATVVYGEDCPEYCDHPGQCARDREAITAVEREAEGAWLRVAEAGYPGYDYDPNDSRALGF